MTFIKFKHFINRNFEYSLQQTLNFPFQIYQLGFLNVCYGWVLQNIFSLAVFSLLGQSP
jgi:hypothetical protein